MVPFTIVLPVIASCLICLFGLIWYRRKNIDSSLAKLEAKIDKYSRQENKDEVVVRKLLKSIYGYLDVGIDKNKPELVHKALDLLKLAFGGGMVRVDEPVHLMSVTVKAIRKCDPGLAGFFIDVYRPMLRHIPAENGTYLIQQLAVIGVMALREKHNFLAAKAADVIFAGLDKHDWTKHPATLITAMKALSRLGSLSIRRHDPDLFREIGTRLFAILKTKVHCSTQDIKVRRAVAVVLNNWLDRIAKSNHAANADNLEDIWEFAASMVAAGIVTDDILMEMLSEWKNIAGAASLNPYSQVSSLIVAQILELAVKEYKFEFFKRVVHEIARLGILAVTHRGLEDGFKVIRPLLDLGRKLMVDELKFGVDGFTEGFRHQALYLVVKECIVIVEFLARQNMLKTTPDIILECCKIWQSDKSAAFINKSVKKYCQLLVVYWMQVKQRQAKKMPPSEELMEPALLSEEEKKKLGFLELAPNI